MYTYIYIYIYLHATRNSLFFYTCRFATSCVPLHASLNSFATLCLPLHVSLNSFATSCLPLHVLFTLNSFCRRTMCSRRPFFIFIFSAGSNGGRTGCCRDGGIDSVSLCLSVSLSLFVDGLMGSKYIKPCLATPHQPIRGKHARLRCGLKTTLCVQPNIFNETESGVVRKRFQTPNIFNRNWSNA